MIAVAIAQLLVGLGIAGNWPTVPPYRCTTTAAQLTSSVMTSRHRSAPSSAARSRSVVANAANPPPPQRTGGWGVAKAAARNPPGPAGQQFLPPEPDGMPITRRRGFPPRERRFGRCISAGTETFGVDNACRDGIAGRALT
jgi:hypothetical protein